MKNILVEFHGKLYFRNQVHRKRIYSNNSEAVERSIIWYSS